MPFGCGKQNKQIKTLFVLPLKNIKNKRHAVIDDLHAACFFAAVLPYALCFPMPFGFYCFFLYNMIYL